MSLITNKIKLWHEGISKFSTNFKFDSPYGICIDYHNYIYIGDKYKPCIYVITPEGKLVRTIGDSNSETEAGLTMPCELAVDSLFNLYVADCSTHRILKYNVIWGGLVNSLGREYLCYPKSITTNILDQVFIPNTESETINIYNKEGVLLYIITDLYAKPISLDADCTLNLHVLVDKGILVFNHLGKYVSSIDLDLNNPTSLCKYENYYYVIHRTKNDYDDPHVVKYSLTGQVIKEWTMITTKKRYHANSLFAKDGFLWVSELFTSSVIKIKL